MSSRALSVLVSLVVLPVPTFSQDTHPILIRDVRVFDGQRASTHRSVLIDKGTIVRISSPRLNVSGAEVIQGEGRTLLPGLIDAHVHIGNDGALRQALALGVTTVLDMLQRAKGLDSPDMADVRTAGIGATAPGGHPSELGGPPFPTLSSPGEAQSFVAQRVAEGSDYIKIIYDDMALIMKSLPMLDYTTLTALVKAAHDHGKLAVVHIMTEQQAREAISAGADGLVHMYLGRTSSADFGRYAAEHHVFIVPTLVTLYSLCGIGDGKELLDDPRLNPYIQPDFARMLTIAWKPDPELCRGADEGMHELTAARVPLLAGTDAGVPGTTYGASLHGELELLVKEGMTPIQALASATSLPAHYFHLDDRGSIRPGARADMVLVNGDPMRNILATRDIVIVWKRGVATKREKNQPKNVSGL